MAAVLGVLAAGAVEFAWRALGHLPTVDPEDLELWAARRRAASDGRAKTLVIIGKSRAQMDLDLATFEQRLPGWRIEQLALRGRGAWAAFADLAHDESFRGKVLFSLTEPDLARSERGGQDRAVRLAHEMGPAQHLDALLRSEVSARLVSRSAELKPERVLKNFAHGRTPTPQFIIVGSDRRAYADFSRIDVALIKGQVEAVQRRAAANMRGRRPNAEAWLAEARELQPLLDRLRARGGNALLLHLPVSGSSAQFSDVFYPRQMFWNTLSAALTMPSLHFQSLPSLSGFACPDTSHLDKKDAPRFTAALLEELVRIGFLQIDS